MTELFTAQSKWIWLNNSWQPNRYMEARLDFNTSGTARLCISVEGQYAAFLKLFSALS